MSRAGSLAGVVGLLTLALSALVARAADEAAEAGKWTVISDGVTDKLTAEGKKIGYPGLTAGVSVDAKNGDVYMVVCDQGLWKSTDQGKSFTRVDGGKVGGRCETGFALNADPAGGRLMCFMVYGGSALTTDGGKTFTPSKSSHVDFGAVDWEATGKAMLMLRHESGGMLTFSDDAGATWHDLGKGFQSLVGVFDPQTLIASKGDGILRSTDGGKTWKKVSDAQPSGAVVKVRNGVGFLVGKDGLLVSKDKGASWELLGERVKAVWGPYFGKNDSHLIVVGEKGVLETTDAGKTWTVIAPLPPEFKARPAYANFAYDAQRNILYASTMGKPTYKLQR